jgi:hypothetical protein
VLGLCGPVDATRVLGEGGRMVVEEELHIEDWAGLGGRSVCVTTALPSSLNSIVAIYHRPLNSSPHDRRSAKQLESPCSSTGLPVEAGRNCVDSLNGQTTLEKVNLSSR